MKRVLLALLLLAGALDASAQIFYNPGGGGGSGSFTSPGAGIPVDTNGSSAWAARCLAASTGISIANTCGAAGNFTISIDTSTTPQYSSGTASVSATGTVGTFYFETDRPGINAYPATNTAHWILSAPATLNVQGDTFYASGTDTLARLAKDTNATRYLSNTGTTNNPAWAQVNLANGVSGNLLWSNSIDPMTSLDMYDDFCNGLNTNGNIGSNGFGGIAVASGTLTIAKGTITNPCVYRLVSHATNDNSGWIISFIQNQIDARLDWSTTVWTMRAVIIPGSNSTSSTTAAWYFGMSSSSSLDPSASATQGAWIRWDSDRSDTTYVAALCNASGANGCGSTGDAANANVQASTITPSAGTPNYVEVSHDMTGPGATEKYSFKVNGETYVTFCSSGCTDVNTHSPGSAVMMPVFVYLTRNTTGAVSGDIDVFQMHLTISARY